MSGNYEKKTVIGNIADIDDTNHKVVMNWSAFNNVDYGKDLVLKGAFKKTIEERFPKGHIYWLKNHVPEIDSIIGKIDGLWEDGFHLKASGIPYDDNIFKMYQDGILRQHSVGFIAVQKEHKDGVRIIKEMMLMEGSTVLWGMNPDTDTVSVKGLVTLEECRDEMDCLIKAIDKGTYTDEFFPLLKIRLKQIQSNYNDLVAESITAREPNENSLNQDNELDTKQVINSINNLKNLFK